MELLSGFGNRGAELGLLSMKVDIEDTEFLSKYFILQDFSSKLTAGKISVTFNGSGYLKTGSEVLIECVDSAGQSLYIESTAKTSLVYKEASTYVLSIHVYSEISNGPAKLILIGTLINGAKVRWVGNLMIDKNLSNKSDVRFYEKPTLEVTSILSPVLSHIGDLSKIIEYSGSFYSYAVNPQKDSFEISKRNIDVDYRIYLKNALEYADPTGSFNNQMVGSNIDLHVKTIQEPFSYKITNVSYTSSLKVKKILNNSILLLSDALFYKDSKKRDTIINVVDGDFYIKYPYVSYNTSSENYLKADTKTGKVDIKQSYADVTYRNLKTFSGFIARHKLYRKSLFSIGDFEIISDEPLTSTELLQDKITTNNYFNKMGSFSNDMHVKKYWFSNSTLQLTQSSFKLNEALYLNYTGSYSDLTSFDRYAIVKDNSSYVGRTSEYYKYDINEFAFSSGSSYDSNFIALKKNVNYLLSLNAIIYKDTSTLTDSDAGLGFYFTSSVSDVNIQTSALNNQIGLMKIGFISAYEFLKEKIYTDTVKIQFTVSSDLYGTLVIIPYKSTAIISNLSLKPYGDYGFSPDVLSTKIPFPVAVANETFELKAELFDINSNLVYSDLRTVASFDATGSSLAIYTPSVKDPSNTTFISGSLDISKSLTVGKDATIKGDLEIQGTVRFTGLTECMYKNPVYGTEYPSYKRHLAVDTVTGELCYSNIVGATGSAFKTGYALKLYDPTSTSKYFPFRSIPSVAYKNISILEDGTRVVNTAYTSFQYNPPVSNIPIYQIREE